MLNPDFRDILHEFCDAQVEFLLVGAYAMAAHGVPRATGDIDLWVRCRPENAQRVMTALARFGAPQEHALLPRLKSRRQEPASADRSCAGERRPPRCGRRDFSRRAQPNISSPPRTSAPPGS